jgi:thiol:disulfide interchange protein DsbD
MRHRLAGLLLSALSLWIADAAAAPVRVDAVEADLVSEFDAVSPGTTAWLGLRLSHDPHWHTYWVNPGDAGLPTRLNWKLEPGFTAGPIQWPLPQVLRAGPLANYGYEGTVLLPVEVSVPRGAAAGSSAHFSARADWLVCNDVCIPGGADLVLDLPVRGAPDLHPGRYAAEFSAARARVPQPISLADPKAILDGKRVRLEFVRTPAPTHLTFLPLDANRIQPAAAQDLSTAGGRVDLDLSVAEAPAPDFARLRGVLVADGGPSASGAASGWAGTVDVPVRAGAIPAAAPSPAAPSAGESAATGSTFWVLVGAFFGGAILNLMPCVFPILSLKLLGLVQHRSSGGPSLRAHGAAFAVGAVASFVALAAVLVGLRAAGSEIGWGFQLQTPIVVALLIALFFLIGMNLLGAFEFTFGSGLANSRVARGLDGEGLRGSFATGVLAVVVASPCTAPFMGAALGYAVTQPAPVALAVFALLGAGMAAPYVVLTTFPGWLARLPRPGAWMERFKQILAFPMFGTCVWLLWVLAQQVDLDGWALMLAALVALGLAAWSAGLAQRGAGAFAWVGACALAAALAAMLAAAGPGAVHAAQAGAALRHDDGRWAAWSPDAQQRALALNEPVFVDFTAAWCVTCQANKRLVLYSRSVADAFRSKGVSLMRADWTNRNEAIARELARFHRDGVPLYVLYDRAGQAHVLPEILTQSRVLDALEPL